MKKKISELSPEEQEKVRAYNREQKAKSRANQKAAAYIPTANEAADRFAIDFPEREKELNAYVEQFSNKVVEELGRNLGSPQKDPSGNVVGWDHDEEFTVDRIARCLLGLKKNWIQKVRCPEGELVAGLYFADSSGSVVESAHRHGLKMSQTFNLLYRELLEMLDRHYGCQQTQDAATIRAELAGTYVLPPLPELPKPESKPGAPPVPNDAEILEEGRIRLLNQSQPQFRMQDPDASPQARQYLDGTLRLGDSAGQDGVLGRAFLKSWRK
jgi:hypothetical protein